MKKFSPALRPIHYASVSGGKDSLYMLRVLLKYPDRFPLDLAVHYELEIDYPWVKDVVDYMENELRKINIPLVRIRPRVSWNELYEKWGFPTRKVRWCNKHYKLDCEKQLKEWVLQQNCRPVAYIGFCADEVKRFKYQVGAIEDGQSEVYPLAECGIDEDFILEWARNVDLFNDYYKYNKRQGCMYCPMSAMDNLAYLNLFYPEHYTRLMELARNTEKKFDTTIFQSKDKYNGRYNVDYIDNRVKIKYVPLLLAQLQTKE